jgi:hypothetical protein
VNGDGVPDVILGAPFAEAGDYEGYAQVLFTDPSTRVVDLSDPSTPGIRIHENPHPSFGTLGYTVSGAGDVNGDGLDDVIVGHSFGDAYVVFGSSVSGTVNVDALGDHGFRIRASNVLDGSLGSAVAGLGDMNGDGLSDVAVGAPDAFGGGSGTGSAFVVFGKASTDPVDVSALGSGGFRVDGFVPFNSVGEALAGPGDVNGDGRPDLVVSSPQAGSGIAWVVFGKATTDRVDLRTARANGEGFGINGVTGFLGGSVAGAGDVNGDGLQDVIVGAHQAIAPACPIGSGLYGCGAAFVVFGKREAVAVNVGTPGPWGFRIQGAVPAEGAARSVDGLGDLNGDGLSDVIVGAPNKHLFGLPQDTSSVYVVFGKASTELVDLGSLVDGGFRLTGNALGDAVAGVGDVNGDGRPDLLTSGTYLVFGPKCQMPPPAGSQRPDRPPCKF